MNSVDDRRNSEGYIDMTAYMAIKKIEDARNNMIKAKPGEIYNVEISTGEMQALVIANQGSYVSSLLLSDYRSETNCIEVRSVSMKYTDAGKVSYIKNDRIRNFVKVLPDEEFDEVLDGIIDALGLAKRVEIAEKDRNEQVYEKCYLSDQGKEDFSGPEHSLEMAEQRADIYKNLYEDLLERVISNG